MGPGARERQGDTRDTRDRGADAVGDGQHRARADNSPGSPSSRYLSRTAICSCSPSGIGASRAGRRVRRGLYELVMLSGPSGMESRASSPGACRPPDSTATIAARPWEGCGPLSRASHDGSPGEGRWSCALQQEAGMRVGAVLPMPEGKISALQADIDALKGNNLLVPSTSLPAGIRARLQRLARNGRRVGWARTLRGPWWTCVSARRSRARAGRVRRSAVPLLGRSDGTLREGVMAAVPPWRRSSDLGDHR